MNRENKLVETGSSERAEGLTAVEGKKFAKVKQSTSELRLLFTLFEV